MGPLGDAARPAARTCSAYDIAQEYSRYHIKETDTKQDIIPAYRGLVYIDHDTNMVTKITLNPYDIPADFSDPRSARVAGLSTSRTSATATTCCR